MTESKVFEAVKSLSAAEQAGFGLFLQGPYFHRGFSAQELKPFYELILAYQLGNRHISLTKESAHSLVFPGQSYMESRMDRLMFELNRLIKTFLLIKHYLREENELEQMLNWATIMRSKGQSMEVAKQAEKLKKSNQALTKDSINNYFYDYLIAQEEHEWHSIYNKQKNDLGLPEVLKSLDLFYFSKRLEMLNRFLLQQKVASLETPEIVRHALEATHAPPFFLEQSPILSISGKIHELLRQSPPSVAGFEELMQMLLQNTSKLSEQALSEFYAYLRNYCTILIEYGHSEFVETLHQLHKDNLEKGFFYYDGKIQPNAVANIIQYALRLHNIGWARQFLETHKDKIIDENDSRDFYRMNKALCLFAEKKYDEALDAIPFGSTYSGYHLMARRLELKIYYEMQSELLPSKIDAFKMFVSRAGSKRFPPRFSEMYTNFGNFILQLSQSIPGDLKRSEQLTGRIQAKKLVAERYWLLEKARELGASKKNQPPEK